MKKTEGLSLLVVVSVDSRMYKYLLSILGMVQRSYNQHCDGA